MSKGSPQPPPAPDPVAVANAQGGANLQTAIGQSELNNVNRVGPGGSTTFNQTGGYRDPSTGQWVPQWTENTQLSPLGNTLLGEQGTLANNAINAPGGLGALDINGGANAAAVNGGVPALNNKVADAAYNEQAGFLNPQWQQNQTDLENQLSRQGISVGSPAYSNAMTQFQNSKNQAYQGASNNAITQGANIAQGDFGLALQGQQQGVNLQQMQQYNPIGLLAALTSGTGIGGGA